MILYVHVNSKDKLDTLTWFYVNHTIQCSSVLWFEVLCASLRAKHSVLILEKPFGLSPQWDPSSRWSTGEHWCWLSTRSLGPITSAFNDRVSSFQEFMHFLNSSK